MNTTGPRLTAPYVDGHIPLYWRYETSGRLERAVQAFLQRDGTLSDEEFGFLKAYIVYWIEAPAWKGLDRATLVAKIDAAETRSALWTVVDELVDAGIDPL